MNCIKCGNKLNEGVAFCSVCGTPVNTPPTNQPNNVVPNQNMNSTVTNNGVSPEPTPILNTPTNNTISTPNNGVTMQPTSNIPPMAEPTPINNQMNGNIQPKPNSNNKFIFIVGGLGIIIVIFMILIATGGIKFKFTINKDTDNKDNNTEVITQPDATTPTQQISADEGKYMDFTDLSVFIPATFESEFNEQESLFTIKSKTKRQAISFQIATIPYQSTTVTTIFENTKKGIINSGAVEVRTKNNVYKNLKYKKFDYKVSNQNYSLIVMESPDIGVIFAGMNSDTATENAYLDTLYEISTKTKTASTSNFAPSKKATSDNIKVNTDINNMTLE